MKRRGALRFQAATFELIGIGPRLSRTALALWKRRERACGITFPASVREWYTFGGPKLGRHIGCGRRTDYMLSLRELGEPISDWYGKPNADFVHAGLLLVICENQGVCNWAVVLDGSEDPPVVVEVDSSDKAKSLAKIRWERCAASFSLFLQSRAWDHGHSLRHPRLALCAHDAPLTPRDLRLLRATFSEGPQTFGHPGVKNYRFYAEDCSLIIWDGEGRTGQSDWFLLAASDQAMMRLLRQVGRCGALVQTLYADADDLRSARLLERVRADLRG
jgi:hypothetical protein